jgi:hypothetical protein
MDGRRAQKVIDMLRKPEFDSEQVDPDINKRMNKAIDDGGIKCFNMLESNLDEYQDLNFGTREMEDIMREIMEDPIKGNHAPAGRTYRYTSRRVQVKKNGRRMAEGMGELCTYQYILVCTCTYWYVLYCT